MIKDDIQAAVLDVAQARGLGTGDHVPMADVRPRLPQYTKAEVTKAIREMYEAGAANLSKAGPAAAHDLRAAVPWGNDNMHMISLTGDHVSPVPAPDPDRVQPGGLPTPVAPSKPPTTKVPAAPKPPVTSPPRAPRGPAASTTPTRAPTRAPARTTPRTPAPPARTAPTATATPRGTGTMPTTRTAAAGGKLPPELDIVGTKPGEAEQNAYLICEQLQLTLQHTAAWCESSANSWWPALENGLKEEGLDGGGRLSQLLHGGDARRTAKHIVQPLYVVQTDLLNAARNVVVFGNRIRVEYFDAIREARRAKERGNGQKTVPVA